VRRRLRVRILTHYFPPEVGAPQTRLEALARGLAQRGLDVSVHTGFPHYPHGRIQPPYRNRPLVRELLESGVRVRRSAVLPAPNRGFAARLGDHLAFAGSALATAGREPVDVVIAETPPLFLAAAAVGYARAKRAALVLHVADLWPESAVQLGALRNSRAIAAADALAGFAYRHAAAVVVPTAGMVAAVEPRAADVRRIPPAVDLDRFAGVPALAAPSAPLRVLYAGTIGLAHGLGTLVEAARRAGPERLELTIAGGGAESAQVREAGRDLEHVRFVGVVPAGAIPELYAGADAGIVLLRDRALFESALPTKLLEVMAAGRPAVLAARGEAAGVVERSGAGIVVAPERPDALVDAWTQLLANPVEAVAMGARGRAAAGDFGRGAMLDRWIELLDRVQRARL
jgi:glycosyltransferase involved in cell wall biosynthesis